MPSELSMPDFSEESKVLITRAQAFEIKFADDYEKAALEDKACVALIRKIDETFDPIVASAKSNYDRAREGRDRHRDPLLECRKLYKGKMGKYEADQEVVRRLEQKRLQDEADKKERERLHAAAEAARLKADEDAREAARLAAQLKEEGNKKAASEVLRAAEAKFNAEKANAMALTEKARTAKAETVALESNVPQVKGVSSSGRKYCEVTDFPALVASVMAHPEYIDVLEAVMPKLNKLAQTMGAKLELVLKGVAVREKTIVSNRA